MNLRPSALPKLAECACFEPNADAGPEAARGSALDDLFRARLEGVPDQAEIFYTPTADDLAAVDWAIGMVRTLAGGSPVVSREDQCRITISGFDNPGTADAIMAERGAHADLKTGQKRNYLEQMAAYSLGLMEQRFASEWTAHLLFCDQREVVSHHFTYEEARRIVAGVVAHYRNPQKQPALCDYCGWCAKADTCPARTNAASTALASTDPTFDFAAVLADDAKLGRFLAVCSVLDDYREKAVVAAKDRLKAGIAVAGWKLQQRKGAEFVNHDDVGRNIQALGFGAVLAAYGNLSAKKFREIWALKLPDKPIPPGVIQPGKPVVALVPDRSAARPVGELMPLNQQPTTQPAN
jgi:hypothetical protein